VTRSVREPAWLEPDLVFLLFLPPILRETGGLRDDVFRRIERDLDLEELRMEA
jgi:hypothetical protein